MRKISAVTKRVGNWNSLSRPVRLGQSWIRSRFQYTLFGAKRRKFLSYFLCITEALCFWRTLTPMLPYPVSIYRYFLFNIPPLSIYLYFHSSFNIPRSIYSSFNIHQFQYTSVSIYLSFNILSFNILSFNIPSVSIYLQFQ